MNLASNSKSIHLGSGRWFNHVAYFLQDMKVNSERVEGFLTLLAFRGVLLGFPAVLLEFD